MWISLLFFLKVSGKALVYGRNPVSYTHLRSILVQNTPQPGMIADIQSTAEMAKVAEQLKYATIVVSSLPLLVMYPCLLYTSVIIMIPTIIIYLIGQRYLLQEIGAGGLKG